MAKTYVVNHTILGTGHMAGEAFTPESGNKGVKNTMGVVVPIDFDRLMNLGAIREATPDEQKAFDQKGLLDPNAVIQGDAPEGQTRVSSDTFAANLAPGDVTPAGGNQSDLTSADAKK